MSSHTILILMALMLASAVNAANFRLGNCGDEIRHSSELTRTAEGYNKIISLLESYVFYIMLWDPSNEEAKFTEFKIDIYLDDEDFYIDYTDENQDSKYFGGSAKWITDDTHEILSSYLELTYYGTDDKYKGIFGMGKKGVAMLYPAYVGDHEIVFVSCREVFFGKSYSTYVLVKREILELDIDTKCAIKAVRSAVGFRTKKPNH